MDIGGRDLEVGVQDSPQVREFVERFFRNRWPEMVQEVSGSTHFFYRRPGDVEVWSNHGAVPESEDTMIMIEYGPDSVGITSHHVPESETYRMSYELSEALLVNWCFFSRGE